MPNERFIYLGDTARVPYGSKPLEMVRAFASEIAEELVARGAKAIVIACNTASAASLPELAARLPVPTWGVVQPGVDAAIDAVAPRYQRRVAVLGTEATIMARAYQDRLEAAGVATWSRACPLFVPIVEEGVSDSDIAELVARHYLADMPPVDAVILGCTHYPLLKPTLSRALGPDVVLIDSSQAVAAVVSADLTRLGLRDPSGRTTSPDDLTYLVTGDVGSFMNTVTRLGGTDAPAERVDLAAARGPKAAQALESPQPSGHLAS